MIFSFVEESVGRTAEFRYNRNMNEIRTGDFAARLGVSHSTISSALRGPLRPAFVRRGVLNLDHPCVADYERETKKRLEGYAAGKKPSGAASDPQKRRRKVMSRERPSSNQLPHETQNSGSREYWATQSEKIRAGKEALKLQRERNEVILVKDVQDLWSQVASNVRRALLSVPRKAAPLVVGLESSKEIESIIYEKITEALIALERMDDQYRRGDDFEE